MFSEHKKNPAIATPVISRQIGETHLRYTSMIWKGMWRQILNYGMEIQKGAS